MSRRQSLVVFILSAFIAFVILSISILITHPNDALMPTLAALENILPSPTVQHYTLSEFDSQPDFTNQFIVQFNDTVQSQADAETLVADLGAEWMEDIPAIQGAVIKFENAIEPEQLETLSSALIIEPNYTVQSLSTYPTNDPMLDLQWAWTKIDIPRLWNATDLNSDVTIAVIDSGVCFSHADLQGRLLDTGFDFVDNDDDPSDQMGHGCAISGIIAANLDNGIGIAGIAPNVNILPIRVLDAQGVGTYANVISAIFYAVDHGASIINLSLGGQNQSQLLEQAIDYAIDHGVQVVAGTGNTGQEGVLYPARYEPVIAVGSYDMDGNRSSFSTYGDEVDVLAPGENIVSTNLNGDYGYYSGTSMAAPHISALLALSGGSVESIDFDDLMSTPQPTPTHSPTDDYVQALVATPTAPAPTMTPTSTIPVPTNTPPAFQCSDLSLEDVILVTYAVTIRIFNSGYPTTLESIEIAYPSIAEYPDLYVEGIYFNAEKFWQGDGTLTPPMYIDENVLSSDGVDRWNPTNPAALYNEITQFDLWFGSSPVFLDEYWTINDLAGTKLSFHNPADPQSPCVIQIPADLYQPPPTPTPASHQCSDLSVTGEIYAGGNLLDFYLSNGGGDTDLQSIDWHFANANDPNAYIRGVSFGQGEIFWDDLWIGDETSISPLYMDPNVMSPDGLYYWQFADLRLPHNATKSLQVVLLNVDVPMRDNWVIEDFSGTTFSFFNPADPQSPCTLTVPYDIEGYVPPSPVPSPSPTADAVANTPPYPECGSTGIELIYVGDNMITYRTEDVSLATDYLANMSHSYISPNMPVSGTIQLSSIYHNSDFIWAGVGGRDTIDEGTWLSSPYLDDDLISIYYNANFPIADYYVPEDFDTAFHVFSNTENGYCTIYPTINYDLLDDPIQCGTDMWFEEMTSDSISFRVEDVTLAQDEITSIYQNLSQSQWYPISATIALDSIEIDSHMLWAGPEGFSVSTPIEGIWSPYSEIDNNLVTFNYDTSTYGYSLDMTKYFDVTDFSTFFHLHNIYSNQTCSEIPDSRDSSQPIPILNHISHTDDSATLEWSYAGTATDYIIEAQNIGREWATLAQIPSSTTTYTDTAFQCSLEKRYRVTAYDSNTDTYSQPSLPLDITLPCAAAEPLNLTVMSVASGTQLNWEMEDGDYDFVRIYRRISGVDNNYLPIDYEYGIDSVYLDPVNFYCDSSVSYQIQSGLQSPSGQYVYSGFVTAELVTSPEYCISLLPPTDFTATRVDDGVQLSWTSPNDTQDYFLIDKKIVGVDTDFSQVTYTSLNAYTHKVSYECDTTQVDYRIRSRHHHSELGWRYSDPIIVRYSEICPHTDLELEITSSNPSPEPYTRVVITLKVKNVGNEVAHDVTIRQHDLVPYYNIGYGVSQGTYSAYGKYWTFDAIHPQTEETLTITLLAQQDILTNEQPISFEIEEADAIDADSAWDNNDPAEDDYAALTLGLTCPSSSIFTVADGDSDGLVQAISTANYETCFPGQDTITLSPDGYYYLDRGFNFFDTSNAFQPITSNVIIKGNRSTIESTHPGRAFHVTDSGHLDINRLRIQRFASPTVDQASVIQSFGTTRLNEVDISYNSGYNGVVVYSTGPSANLEMYNSYVGVNSGDYTIIIGEDSIAHIENSTLYTSDYSSLGGIGVYGTLDTYFSTYYRANSGHLKRLSDDATINLLGNIFHRSTSTTSSCTGTGNPVEGYNSLGYNISKDCSYGHPTDMSGINTLLESSRQFRGGFTPIYSLQEGSPAIDLIPSELCTVNRDQNGTYRPQDSNGDTLPACNAGAYEGGAYNGLVLATELDNTTPSNNDIITLSVELSNQTNTEATDVVVNMNSIHELQYLSATSGTIGTLSVVSGTPQWAIGTLPSHSSATIELHYLVELPYYRRTNSILSDFVATNDGETKTGRHIATIDTGCPPLDYVFNIPAGNSYALENAIQLANNEECSPGANTIILAPNSDYILDGEYDGFGESVPLDAVPFSTLPDITSEITIVGNGSILKPSQSGRRALAVDTGGSLHLQQVTLTDFDIALVNSRDAVIYSKGHLHISDSEFSNNRAPHIITVAEDSTRAIIERSLIWNNTTTRDHYALFTGNGTEALIQNNTFGQDADQPAQNGIHVRGGIFDIRFNTIIGDVGQQYTLYAQYANHINFTGNLMINATCRKSFTWTARYNASNTTTCDLRQTGDIQDVPITLLPLSDYGGYTRTVFPIVGSASIDHVPLEFCYVSDDQRNVGRPIGTLCDAGSVEIDYVLDAPTDTQAITDFDNQLITISWTDNSSDETGFTVLRKGTNDTIWEVLDTLPANTTENVDTDILSCSQTYDYVVYAFDDSGGFSPLSTEATTVNFSCVQLVEPTLSVSAVSQTVLSDIVVDLTWVDTNTNLTGWHIEQRVDGGAWQSISSVTGTPELQQSLLCETTNDFRVQAYREADDVVSNWSNIASFVAGDCPEPPVFASITGTGFNQIDVTLAPYSPGDALIQVEYRKANSTDDWQLKYSDTADQLTTLEITGLICGTEYEFRTQATIDTITPNQLSDWSTATALTQDCIPLEPPTLSLTPISSTDIPGTNANLSWVDTNGDGTNWLIEYRKDDGTWTELTKLSGSPSLSQYLECESSYEYRVLAFQGEMNAPLWNTLSEWSNVVSYVTDTCISKPIILSAVPYQSDKIRVTWDPQPGINRYTRLYRKLGSEINDDPWDNVATSTNTYNGQVNSYLPSCGLTYQFRIQERWNYDGQQYYSDYSDIVVATAHECLTAPVNLTTVSSTETTLTFGWENTTTRTDYETIIFDFDEPTGTWNEIDRIPTSQTEYTVSCSASSTYRLQLYHPIQDEYSPYSDPIIVDGENCITDDPQPGPTFTVTTTEDLQVICGVTYCSLRAAIEAANNMPGANTIILPDGVYFMEIDGVYEDNNRTGDYDVLDDLTILGNASGTTIIDAAKIDRLFEIGTDVDFSIDNVTLQNSNDVLWHDYSEIPGGIIHAYYSGDISITNSVLQDGFGYQGGAIHVESSDSATIHNSIFRNNTSESWGGAVSLYYVDTIITDSLFENNTNLTNHGGAINQTFDTISIYNSVFRDNVSGGSGGGVSARDINEIVDSLFINNQAVNGGGIHAVIGGVVKNSSFINNRATNSGGGIFLWELVRIENVTVANNTAENSGGGIFEYGGNIILNSTIVDNQATNASFDAIGGGLYVDKNYGRNPAIYNTIIGNNESDIAGYEDCHVAGDNIGIIGNSLIESTNTCNLLNNVSNSHFGIDPPLSDLQSASGTYYYLPLAGNPAINNANGAWCPSQDQLGTTRPIGVQCDMGAVESAYLLNPPTNLTAINSEYSYVLLTWQDNSLYEQEMTIERSLDGNDWDGIAHLPPNTNTFIDTTAQCPEDYYYRVTIGANSYTQSSSHVFVSTSAPCEGLTFVYNPLLNIIDETTAQIAWSDDNSDESGYRIMRRVSDTWSEVGMVAADVTTYYDATIDCQSDLTYDYQIQAFRDEDGDEALSNIASVWTGNCPFNTPDGLSPDTITGAAVTLIWNDNSILESGYNIFRKTASQPWVPIANLPADSNAFSDNNLECESQYQYQLQGYQALFDRYTNPVTISVTTGKCAVALPDSISTTVTSSQTSIVWNPIPPQQTSQIIVERAEQETEAIVGLSLNWQVKATLGGGATIFTDHDLRCGMTYSYRLRGYNERYDEYTGYSNTIQITTDECPVPVTNTIGLYHNGRWVFREGFENDSSETTFRFGPQEAGWTPLTGDWDGDGIDGIGIYKEGVFALRDISEQGAVDYVYQFGSTQVDWQPLVGDWNGDGIDTVGLYHEGRFILTNSNTHPTMDYQFSFGKTEAGWQPIAGDWLSHGRDYVGLYKDGIFVLSDTFESRSSGTVIRFGSGEGWIPVAGDWDADGDSTIGLYKDNNWRLSNTNTRTVDIGIRFNYFNGQGYPLASYRGGGEALEALALFTVNNAINVMSPPQAEEITNTPQPSITPMDTNVPISATEVETSPTFTPVSGTEEVTITITSTMDATATLESTALSTTLEATPTMEISATPEPTIAPTVEPTDTIIPPTETVAPSDQPTPEASESATSDSELTEEASNG